MSTFRIAPCFPQDITIVSNAFLDGHMPKANGEFVKIYLYLLRISQHPNGEISLTEIADRMTCTERDVLRAVRYWEKAGLLIVRMSADRMMEEIAFADASRTADDDSRKKNAPSAATGYRDTAAGYRDASAGIQTATRSIDPVAQIKSQSGRTDTKTSAGPDPAGQTKAPNEKSDAITSSGTDPAGPGNDPYGRPDAITSADTGPYGPGNDPYGRPDTITSTDTDPAAQTDNPYGTTAAQVADNSYASAANDAKDIDTDASYARTNGQPASYPAGNRQGGGTSASTGSQQGQPASSVRQGSQKEKAASIAQAGSREAGTATPRSGSRKNAPAYTLTAVRMEELSGGEDFRELLFIAEQYMGRPLTKTDHEKICYFYDALHFSADLIEYLIEYCVNLGHRSIRYIEKVALSWYDAGIRTSQEAQESVGRYHREYYDIFKALGINSHQPIAAEIRIMDKWLSTYGFPMDVITEACTRTVLRTAKPTLGYADGILTNWQKAGVRTFADIAAEDARHEKDKETAKKPPKTGRRSKTPGGSFYNFEQRNYDYRTLEAQLLNMGVASADDQE